MTLLPPCSSRSLLNGRKWGNLQIWFITHRGLQLFAVLMFVIGFLVALANLNTPGGRVGAAHAALGWLLVGLAVVQVLGTLVRPAPDGHHRRKWNLFHWNMGILSMLTALTNVYIGIAVYTKGDAGKLAGWLVIVTLVLVLHIAANVVLAFAAARVTTAASAKHKGPVGIVVVAEACGMGAGGRYS